MKRLLNILINCDLSSSGENRARYIQLLLHGLYTPWTLPVGSSEQALQGLVDSLLVNVEGNIVVIMNSRFMKQSLDHCVFKDIVFSFALFTSYRKVQPHTHREASPARSASPRPSLWTLPTPVFCRIRLAALGLHPVLREPLVLLASSPPLSPRTLATPVFRQLPSSRGRASLIVFTNL